MSETICSSQYVCFYGCVCAALGRPSPCRNDTAPHGVHVPLPCEEPSSLDDKARKTAVPVDLDSSEPAMPASQGVSIHRMALRRLLPGVYYIQQLEKQSNTKAEKSGYWFAIAWDTGRRESRAQSGMDDDFPDVVASGRMREEIGRGMWAL
ncbi:Acid Phosphatase Type 7 [Manis pentadactyla]|nr:Acid Phosphatase Type 7 [Manis pentadactyla]